MCRILYVLVGTAVFVAERPAKAVGYTFTNIADTTTIGPSGHELLGFAEPSVSGKNVAFTALGSFDSGIYRGSGGSLTAIARDSDPGPIWARGGYTRPSISGERVAFHGSFGDILQTQGIFVGDGGPLTTIALEYSPAPTGSFVSFGKPSISGSQVAFLGWYAANPSSMHANGIFIGDGGPLTTVIKTGDLLPSGVLGARFEDPRINSGQVVFWALDGDGGVYADATGQLMKIVQVGDIAPAGVFSSLYFFPAVSSEAIAFYGQDGNGWGVFEFKNGSVTPIVRGSDMAPVGTFAAFESQPLIGGSTVAFFASYGEAEVEGAGIFVGDGGGLTSVIKTGDSLFGSTVIELANIPGQPQFGFDADGSGSVAFLYTLADGRMGVGLGRPVPEPTAASLASIVAIALCTNYRQRRKATS